MAEFDKPDYVLVYDGHGGVRMAPPGTRSDAPPEGQISWPAAPEPQIALETVTVPRRPAYVLPVVGAVGLCLAGLALGVVARPRLAAISTPRPAPMQPAPQQPDARTPGAQMQVMALAPAPAADSAAAARADRLEAPPPDQRPASLKVAPSTPTTAGPYPVIADNTPARPRAGPDCRGARSAAEAMVCADPDLARADRRLARAYRAAARSGVPLGQLRAEQDDWLDLREDAAQRSPHAVVQVYEQRIEELESMAAAAEPR